MEARLAAIETAHQSACEEQLNLIDDLNREKEGLRKDITAVKGTTQERVDNISTEDSRRAQEVALRQD